MLAVLFWSIITLLFLDFTGSIHLWFGWMAKIQFLPAVLALDLGIVILLVLLTLIFGRVYCSVICPLGVFQDVISRFASLRKKNRFGYTKPLALLRYSMLVLFILALVAGAGSFVALLAPYSSYGRIVSNLFSPIYKYGNNILADIAAHYESYAIYETEIWIKSVPVFIIAAATLVVIFILAWRGGRTYCNTICPVGTVLGFISKYSLFKPVIDTAKCNSCTACEKNCKASCINSKEHTVDYSRCVACMDCIGRCKKGAISYAFVGFGKDKKSETATSAEGKEGGENGRRAFLAATAVVASTTLLKAQEDKVDGGLAVIEDKKIPKRNTPIVPPGALSLKNMAQHCTGCQLCVSACPNGVLRPSSSLMTLMQPESSYEKGFCRPECTKCSDVCPAGAIRPLDSVEKSSIQIGHAVWVKENCLPLTKGVSCGLCARRCPVGAIQMVLSDPENEKSPKIPVVNEERCIGCGACENLCPSRPFSAIYVEGHSVHKYI